MVLRYCVFEKCGNQRSKYSNISFFSFPKDEELLQKWLDFINRYNKNPLSKNLLDREKMKVCHMHFQKDQIQTKSNNDRALQRNSVPRCPPGIIDKAFALSKPVPKKKTKKPKESDSGKGRKALAPSKNNPKATQTTLEGNPLFHTINGYVVDLRIAAQQDTFRLPNGKLIQVRRQPKKPSDLETNATTPPAKPKPVFVTKKTNAETQASDKPTAAPRPSAAQVELNMPPAVTSAHSDKASKTYTNRRTLNQPPRAPPGPLPVRAPSSPTIPSTLPVLSQPSTTCALPTVSPTLPVISRPSVAPAAPTAPSLQPRRTPIIVPPSLTALQALLHKTHPDSLFGDHLKGFESRLISTAELSLHVVTKINNFLHSNPYRNAADTKDLRDLYHHVAYILKYAVDRFNGLEDDCVQDIQHMGFTKQSDLGPLLREKAPDKTPPKSPETTEETAEGAPAATEDEAEEDDDCAIIEERPDVIEVDSDDDEADTDEAEESDDQTAEQTGITLGPKQLRICSDTESIGQEDDASNDSEQVERAQRKVDSEEPAQYEPSEQQPIESEATEEATQFEVVMNEVRETTTIVQDYYYAEVSGDEDEDGEFPQQPEHQGDDEAMDMDDDAASSGEQAPMGDEEETEELIEIIEGDIDLELEDGQEYKVIEVIDGDYDTW